MDQENKTILIIDDDSRNIFALSAVLRSKGYTVLSAGMAAAGLSMLKSHKEIRVVLIDIMMPEMDGYEAIRQIRKDSEVSELPVIAVTAHAMVGDREKILKAGADAYISKPIDVDRLLNLLNQY
ncbi:MAG: response regulator [Candidatus Dadabacteria bacterium]